MSRSFTVSCPRRPTGASAFPSPLCNGPSIWSLGIPLSTVQRAINHSLCFGGYVDGQQVAFARVITDRATFGYLADVFVLPAHRGRGYSKALMAAIVDHAALQGLRRLMLATSDAQGLYAGFGFTPPRAPGSLMEKYDPEIYQRP